MNQPRLAPIDQSKLRETVYDALRQAFTRGEFAPGDVVSLRDLAAQLGTSMTPVREAVRRLVAEGALVDTPSRTLMVPPFNASRITDLKAARLALEALVLEGAMARMTDADIAALEAMLDDAGADGILPDLELNYAFHFALYRISGSEVLVPLIEALWMQYGAYLNLVIREHSAQTIDEHRHHREIVAALKAGDMATARAALIRDIERSFAILAHRIDEAARHD
ncbi:HTH-type transcriptional regulator McbR [Roseivivax sp. THAF40]|uniref:GntR family transcriptional regulator n=1 Tax=unclassified Roseivivax TaxID=2639302 RepID=UPI0012691D00|nr:MULTISPECIES: GntR family transcriptional regulator [unclassified Roseivivax]QFS83557.1 HTH-type transcriptional regulator McbR [Roseivivax sp. THAF197b]QFT47302.1 HTH-type transcriptional regulator McbR [Roseivivax sp. THAF40]